MTAADVWLTSVSLGEERIKVPLYFILPSSVKFQLQIKRHDRWKTAWTNLKAPRRLQAATAAEAQRRREAARDDRSSCQTKWGSVQLVAEAASLWELHLFCVHWNIVTCLENRITAGVWVWLRVWDTKSNHFTTGRDYRARILQTLTTGFKQLKKST